MTFRIIRRLFQIRPGEGRIALLMFLYIFLAIAVLLIVKPAVNSLFLSSMGADQLPLAFVLVCLAALLSSLGYQRLLRRFRLRRIIRATLWVSVGVLVSLAALLYTNSAGPVALYGFYIWISIFGILVASQFWMLANLAFNVREAKRLFGFIGAGAISGGITGGYLTSVLSPFIGLAALVLIAAILLSVNIFLLEGIWRIRIRHLGVLRQENRRSRVVVNPLREIRSSAHLSLIALIVAVGVLVAKLVDYLFSDLAARELTDPEELAAFFGFWFSTFNLLSLGVQLLLTRRVVGTWGVGTSLLLLPAGVFVAGALFFLFPGLVLVIVLKALDGILKQSINKSAFEMLALPLPQEVKQRTKYFIDVVVDSLATGLAGLLLIGLINGLELSNFYVVLLILLFSLFWIVLILRVRGTFYRAFRDNLGVAVSGSARKGRREVRPSMLRVMKQVLRSGEDRQRLYMLSRLADNPDSRLAAEVRDLLEYPNTEIQAAALRVLYYLDARTMPTGITPLLEAGHPELTQAVMEFLFLHANRNTGFLYDRYLDHPDPLLRQSALFALGREARDNPRLTREYNLPKRLGELLPATADDCPPLLLRSIGAASFREGFPLIRQALGSGNPETVLAGMEAAGLSMDPDFLDPLMGLLVAKEYRAEAIASLVALGPGIVPLLTDGVNRGRWTLEACRFVPQVLKKFGSQSAVDQLFMLFDAFDLGIRLEVVQALTDLHSDRPHLRFNRMQVIRRIHEECRLYQQTMTAMHSQIISSYRNRRRGGGAVAASEKEARSALLDLLETRLEAGLERIFGLLGLKFPAADMQRAYQGIISNEDADRTRALEFLDNLLTGTLRRRLLPILEAGSPDWDAEGDVEQLAHRVPTEAECFHQLLELRDQKLLLTVLNLIGIQADARYDAPVRRLLDHPLPRVQEAARRVLSV